MNLVKITFIIYFSCEHVACGHDFNYFNSLYINAIESDFKLHKNLN